MIKKNVFAEMPDDELEALYDVFENAKKNGDALPQEFDQYILDYRRTYQFQVETDEARQEIEKMLVHECMQRFYEEEPGTAYLKPVPECRGIAEDTGELIYGAAFAVNEEDLYIMPQPYMEGGQIKQGTVKKIKENTLSIAIGITDSNGKPIYTGDYVSYGYENNPYQIIFAHDEYAFFAYDKKTGDRKPIGEAAPSMRVLAEK